MREEELCVDLTERVGEGGTEERERRERDERERERET